ncbi:MAG TPA: type II toxin-antitoxin system VapB family antitoxin [Coriobacteriia bacterium]|jgi:Tfp pilus assembly protein PilW
MRTTIRIDDRLLAEAKARAAESGRTVAAVIDDALREAFTRRATADSPARRTLPVFRASRLAPGVDLDDGVALLDLMERAKP